VIASSAFTWFPKENIQLNDFENLDRETFKKIINKFKANYTAIELIQAEVESCELVGEKYVVKGSFEVDLYFDEVLNKITDQFTIDFHKQEDSAYWEMHKVMIGGVRF
jgi:division protein CdvB (Snf7/Vps24/ESCRT-III family)